MLCKYLLQCNYKCKHLCKYLLQCNYKCEHKSLFFKNICVVGYLKLRFYCLTCSVADFRDFNS